MIGRLLEGSGPVDGGILCRLWMEAGRPIRNVHGGGKSNNGTHFTHARLKVAPHGIMD